MPDKSSLIQQFMIKQMLAVHGEAKLNMISPFGHGPEQHYGRPFKPNWCHGLRPPTISRTISNQQRDSKK